MISIYKGHTSLTQNELAAGYTDLVQEWSRHTNTVSVLLALLSQTSMHNSLFPGHGHSPSLILTTLSKIFPLMDVALHDFRTG